MNDQRVYQMSRLAIYEEEHKEQLDGARKYFRSDYIGRQLISAALRTTAAYLLILAGWGLFHMDILTLNFTEVNLTVLLGGMAAGYLGLLGIMLICTYLIWSSRYANAEDELDYYHECLKSLEKSYEEEDLDKEIRQSIKRG